MDRYPKSYDIGMRVRICGSAKTGVIADKTVGDDSHVGTDYLVRFDDESTHSYAWRMLSLVDPTNETMKWT
jgi:hypothetical protein